MTDLSTLRREFQAALKLAGLTQARFATALDLTPSWLSRVLTGRAVSLKLVTKIQHFIHFQKFRQSQSFDPQAFTHFQQGAVRSSTGAAQTPEEN